MQNNEKFSLLSLKFLFNFIQIFTIVIDKTMNETIAN